MSAPAAPAACGACDHDDVHFRCCGCQHYDGGCECPRFCDPIPECPTCGRQFRAKYQLQIHRLAKPPSCQPKKEGS